MKTSLLQLLSRWQPRWLPHPPPAMNGPRGARGGVAAPGVCCHAAVCAQPGRFEKMTPHEESVRIPFLIRIIPAIQIFVLVGIAFALKVYFDPVPGAGWLDAVFAVLWLLLLGWCFVPRDPAIDADGHESAGQRLAFRMGKTLHKVLHLGRRDTAVRDKPR